MAEIIQLPKDKKIDGRSLKPLLEEKNLEDVPAYFESAPGISKPKEQICGIRTSEYKYSRQKDSLLGNTKLFDLKIDPFEENNISQQKPDVVKKLEAKLSQILEDRLSDEDKEEINKDEMKKIEEELKKLGYI